MPNGQRYYHRVATGFMCLLFAGFGVLTVYPLLRPAASQPGKWLWIASLVYAAIAGMGIVLQFWFQTSIIGEFHLDEHTFRFRPLGRSTMQTRTLSEIANVREWRGRGQSLGYALVFRDGSKAYLQYCVSNSTAAAEILRSCAAGSPHR